MSENTIIEYLLLNEITGEDVDFLNITAIEFQIVAMEGQTSYSYDASDSGWCDGSTGARIINKNDRALFKNVDPSDQTFLNLKYGDRLLKLTKINNLV